MSTTLQKSSPDTLSELFATSLHGIHRSMTQDTSEESEELSQLEEAKLDAYLDAYVKSQMEIARRMLTISSAAIGLIVTLAASLDTILEETGILMVASLIFFVGTVFATMRSIFIDGKYLLEASSDLRNEERSDAVKRLSRKTNCWSKTGIWLFGSGTVTLVLLTIITIQTNG